MQCVYTQWWAYTDMHVYVYVYTLIYAYACRCIHTYNVGIQFYTYTDTDVHTTFSIHTFMLTVCLGYRWVWPGCLLLYHREFC